MGKRKRTSPQRIQAKHAVEQVSSQQQEHSPQRFEDIGATQVQHEPQLPPILSSQPEEGEIPQASIPPMQEEPSSPSVPKKHKRIKIQMEKR